MYVHFLTRKHLLALKQNKVVGRTKCCKNTKFLVIVPQA